MPVGVKPWDCGGDVEWGSETATHQQAPATPMNSAKAATPRKEILLCGILFRGQEMERWK